MVMRGRPVVVLVASVALMLAACGGDHMGMGPAPADIDNKPPYGQGGEVGKTYDYALYTHGGIEWARIDGVWWHTEPIDDGNANPPSGWGNPYNAGELVVLDDFTAVYSSGGDINVEFNRTNNVKGPFICQ